MASSRRKFVVGQFSTVLSVVCLLLVLGTAKVRAADDPKFAVVTIMNNTPDVTITFNWRFGNGTWQPYKLAPGETVFLWHTLDVNGKSPAPQVMFQEGINKAFPFKKTMTLQFYAAPDKSAALGYPYMFNRDTADNNYIHLDG